MSQYDPRRLPVERERRGSGWNRLGIALGVIAAVLLVMNARDLGRYIKISNM